jgi:asparagine synthase (glutamine-hydrolysing)
MCGIAGFIYLKNSVPGAGKLLQEMTDKIRHRGPDGEGFLLLDDAGKAHSYYGNDSVLEGDQRPAYIPQKHISESFQQSFRLGFGHRRLSIVDLSALGHQPMCYKNRYWIVFNGEIYNYVELREELEKLGHRFVSHTDTEVIMAAYEQWGNKCLNRFNGMWSFIILDTERNGVFIARDRFGIKPFHYYFDGNVFVFASEIKAILSHPAVRTKPSLSYCKEYLREGPKEFLHETAFENIFRLDNAAYIETSIDELGKANLKGKKFWELKAGEGSVVFDEKELDQYAKEYYELLSDAVRLRLRADVKVGSALSGGLDSSSIVCLVNQELRKQNKTEQQETFSSVYQSEGVQDCDESEYINRIAKTLEVKSNQVEPRMKDVISEHRKMIYHMDTPPDSSCMSGWHTFKLVGASDVTVTLDGQGADEQQGGYLYYLVNFFAQRKNTEEENEFKKVPGADKFIKAGNKLRAARSVMPEKLVRGVLRKMNLTPDYLLPLNQRLVSDTTHRLLTLIHYSDRIPMAFSIESRMPFMDYRLAEFMARIPGTYKLHKGWTKYIARVAMEKYLPAEVTWRKDKMGWPIPEEFWFRGELKEQFCNAIEKSVFLRELGVGQDIRQRIAGKEPINNLLRLYNLATWYEVFFEHEQ